MCACYNVVCDCVCYASHVCIVSVLVHVIYILVKCTGL